MKIRATVNYPVCVEMDIDVDESKLEDFDYQLELIAQLKDEADKGLESSSVEPYINECNISELEE
jgi:hypothetical protein